jgi:hypothetical protein
MAKLGESWNNDVWSKIKMDYQTDVETITIDGVLPPDDGSKKYEWFIKIV